MSVFFNAYVMIGKH